jgi:hypothetical protein
VRGGRGVDFFAGLADGAERGADGDLGAGGGESFRRVPSKNDSSSIVALSVSTSASMSPDLTASPSCFSHLTSVPTVMVSLSFGISMI